MKKQFWQDFGKVFLVVNGGMLVKFITRWRRVQAYFSEGVQQVGMLKTIALFSGVYLFCMMILCLITFGYRGLKHQFKKRRKNH